MEDQEDAASTRKTAYSALRVAARHRRAGVRDNNLSFAKTSSRHQMPHIGLI